MGIPILSNLWDTLIGKGADLISEFITDKDLAKQLEFKFKELLEKNRAEYDTLVITVEKDIFEAQQKTIQAELSQSDLYTKRTRPSIARKSFYAGLAYALLTAIPDSGIQIGSWVLAQWNFEWSVLMLLYSPALTYMGVRGAEKWKAGKA